MATKVTDKGIIYPDGTEQTTAAFGSGGGSGGGIEEAPKDGKQYARQDESWTEVTGGSGSGAVDAYTKSETNTLLDSKADKSDTYTKAEIDASQAEQDTKIAANTAKVSNATHTGDVTGSVALTIGSKKVTGAKIADNTINALQLNVSGNGTTAQYLRSNANGSFSWVTPAAGGATNVYHAIGAYASQELTEKTRAEGSTATFTGRPGTWRIMSVLTAVGGGSVRENNYLIIRIS